MQSTNTHNDLVTVVTVTFNAEELLEETILSVINQSYKNIEYIIIDGASSDNTIEIIKKYEDKIDYWISEVDNGIYYAMNKAIDKATGKWINFMNAGDTFFNLDTIKNVMLQKDCKADLIYGNFQIKETKYIKKAFDQSKWHFHMPFCHQTLFTRTDIMKKVQFDTSFKLAADHNFILKMYKDHKKFNYIDQTLAIFTLGGFAESNEFLMNIESLKVLLNHKVPQDDINQSDWYKAFHKNICSEETIQITHLNEKIQEQKQIIYLQEKKLNQFSTLQDAIQKIKYYSIWRQPLKKYKSYKTLLINNDLIKGYKIENK